ncbi:bifunctional (p)ppGpp synthetase/guanosine-3',5'-bis(diphosphate) 3'-pyrophosphohydrolase [Campylobacter sp. 19-13652]|uniref:RelA/SpoT family protein n=1 Tax=Campylobacter sp. 19-13652 TaxID=2840180 RepID=UPI001C776D05|nr:RelA/SpoT family protein [Campylobacter sp. 19-13652]BCX79762.1 bifunctional (p)ppGpp synthase/hydrolase [Campylobacter sp. 19-13652]
MANNIFFEQLVKDVVAINSVTDAKELLASLFPNSYLVQKAIDFCIVSHEGQYRKSGEPYAIHPILVACFVAYMGADEAMIVAALLHDVVEDTDATLSDVRDAFGADAAKLVEGLTKIVNIREDKLVSSSSNEKLASSALTFRRMLLISIEDVRVLVIKLCDRLHNMLTISALRPEKQKRIAEETLMVYAPIAHRLGISSIKNLLEDLSFERIMPEDYKKIDDYINEQQQKLSLIINDFVDRVGHILLTNGFAEGTFEIQKRIKHHYSIFLKMQRKGISIEEVLDLLAVRVLVDAPLDCYRVLGNLHMHFNPLISRFKDYIALPKQNGYQTIHTTIFDNKSIFEVQVRTYDMHKTAEFGVAAHWKYKSGGLNPRLDWLSDISASSVENNAEEMYEFAKDSLYAEDIAVYSPKGSIFTLPRGATALDYAYEVHTEVGLYASQAYINRVRVPLLTELKNGDIVRIVTGDEPKYRCSWLENVKTGKAKAAIRSLCKQKIKEINTQYASNILKGVFDISARRLIEWLELDGASKKFVRAATDSVYLQELVNSLRKYTKKLSPFSIGDRYSVKKQKFENIVIYSNHKISSVEFDYCCNPKRGDDIVGFRHGGTAVVHHKLCKSVGKMLTSEEAIFVKWTRNAPRRYNIVLNLENRRGSLAEFLTYLSRLGANLSSINLNQGSEVDGDFFTISIEIAEHLNANQIRDRLKERYKIVDFVSSNDAYNN